MTLTLRNDTSHPGGGFALLGGPGLSGVTSITIENCFSGQFLGEDGKWGRNPFAFPIEDGPSGTLLLGPHIVDHVPTELQIDLRSGEGKVLGKLFWEDVIPSRNPGSVTSAQVIEQRRWRAEQRAVEERAALARVAMQKAAQEQAEREAAAADVASRIARSEAAERDRYAAMSVLPAVLVPEATVVQAPARRRRWPWVFVLPILLLAIAAAVVIARPALLDQLRAPAKTASTETPPPLQPARPEPEPEPAPAPEAPVTPPPPARVACSAFSGRISDLEGHPDVDKVALGEEALRAGCGAEAFQAFDSSDPQTSEAAAWNLARFYDPNEDNPLYRRAASIHPDFAAAYYKLWRDRSPRQAAALVKICHAEHGGGASLRKSCGR